MTTNTYLGNGMYVTASTLPIITHTDVALTSASSPYTVLAYDEVIRADATSGVITINLPTAVGRAGKTYKIYRTDVASSTNIITIDGNSTETIDGSLTYRLYTAEWVHLESDGANWQVIARSTPTSQGYYMYKNVAHICQIGGYANTTATGMQNSTTSPATGVCWAYPLIVSRTTKFDQIEFSVTTVSTAGQSHAGIYADNGNNYPGALIFDTGNISTTTATAKATTITAGLQTFQPGLYWLVYEQDTATGQYRSLQNLNFITNVFGTSLNTAANSGWMYILTRAYAAFPDPFTAGAALTAGNSTASTPLVAVGLHPV